MVQGLAKDPEHLNGLKGTITRLVDFDCAQYSNNFLMRRIDVRLRATSTDSYERYAHLLAESTDERERLKKELTIHITSFFRDSTMWEAFRSNVIPHLAASKASERSITVWSAGSSTGEEALSIAICFSEALGQSLRGYDVRIIGTDIDADTVHRAREAAYEEIQFRELPHTYKERYFEKVGDGLYIPTRALTKMITYRHADILSPEKPKGLDVIFCRNTVIYFDKETKTGLYEQFFQCLNKGGFLVLGKTELMAGNARSQFKIFDSREHIYLKE